MIEKDKVVVLLSTCPSSGVADSIATALVTEGLAACVNQLPGVRSIYMWQGQVQSDSEVLLMIKSVESHLDAIKARLIELHPYELPEIIALPVCGGSESYLDWVRQTVAPK
jgi:periplasmic divalent cation tolerance protein